MPTIRYRASVGRCAAALPVPAVSPEAATGGACHVAGFPGNLIVRQPGPNVLHVGKLAAKGYYPSDAAGYIRPDVYLLTPPYPMRAPVSRSRDRISPVPAVTPTNVPASLMRRPARIGGSTVTNNPRPMVLWPVRGRPGRYA